MINTLQTTNIWCTRQVLDLPWKLMPHEGVFLSCKSPGDANGSNICFWFILIDDYKFLSLSAIELRIKTQWRQIVHVVLDESHTEFRECILCRDVWNIVEVMNWNDASHDNFCHNKAEKAFSGRRLFTLLITCSEFSVLHSGLFGNVIFKACMAKYLWRKEKL